MRKVLIIQNTISHYRVPVYNRIAKAFEVTVMFSYGEEPVGAEFKTVKIETHKLWKFIVHNMSLNRICKEYDAVVMMMAPNWISMTKLLFIPFRTYKVLTWGIGVPASYSVHYDDKKKSSFGLNLMVKRSDAVIFYSDYPYKKYEKMGIPKKKMFVAHNTVDVLNSELSSDQKDIYLFVGTLYRAKGIQVLLDAYKQALTVNKQIPRLFVVGGGSEFEDIQKWLRTAGMQKNVELTGPIYDELELSKYFRRALLCISPNQAGLSVQKSMGYGVPFVTRKDAFTGGEIFDIASGDNGVLYEKDSELSGILLDAANNPTKYHEMGIRAKEFYNANRTIDIMAQGAIDAVSFALEEQ